MRNSTRTTLLLSRVSEAAGVSMEDLRDLIETVVDEYLGLVPRDELPASNRKTGARVVYGQGHASLSYVSDPEGTDVVPPGWEAPPGYHGP